MFRRVAMGEQVTYLEKIFERKYKMESRNIKKRKEAVSEDNPGKTKIKDKKKKKEVFEDEPESSENENIDDIERLDGNDEGIYSSASEN
jgi:hypothetical protein